MKGVILAGGRGTRLGARTQSTNKHLLHIAGRPMIDHAINTLTDAGLADIAVVTGAEHADAMRERLAATPLATRARLRLATQPTPAGVADALLCAEPLVPEGPLCVLLADNLFEHSIRPHADAFAADPRGAMILLAETTTPQRFAIATFEDADRDRPIADITEKPTNPTSNAAVVGAYFYDARVFDIARAQTPSPRAELEITDVNLAYLRDNALRHAFIDGWWIDAGAPESLRLAEQRLGQDHHA